MVYREPGKESARHHLDAVQVGRRSALRRRPLRRVLQEGLRRKVWSLMAPTWSMVSIDPGLEGCGVAAWDRGRLVRAEYVRAKQMDDPEWAILDGKQMRDWELSAWCAWWEYATPEVRELVLERPQVYARRLNTDPSDLITLALLDGALAAGFRAESQSLKVTTYLPAEHKGQIKKPKGAKDANDYIIRNRALARLTDEEQLGIVQCASGLMHNVWDAIWIGLHHLGRGTNTKTKET